MEVVEGFVFIAGGGRFGSLAAKFFEQRGDVKVLLVDVRQDCPARRYAGLIAASLDCLDFRRGVNMLVSDAVEALTELLERGVVPELVVPTVPGHFAGKVFKNCLERRGFTVAPSKRLLEEALRRLPRDVELYVDEASSVIVCSYMPFDKRCKTPCPQPAVCPVTKRRREKPMFDLLRGAADADVVFILRSTLLTANVGAFSGRELVEALDECVRRGGCTAAVGTACKCHGIINFFEVGRQTETKKTNTHTSQRRQTVPREQSGCSSTQPTMANSSINLPSSILLRVRLSAWGIDGLPSSIHSAIILPVTGPSM